MTIKDWLTNTTKQLTEQGVDSARLDALLLLEDVLQASRATLLTHPEIDLPATTLVKLDSVLQQRLAGIPIAYIQNKKEFYGREFIVTPDVLIPRPETESMIELVKSLCKDGPCKILDVGTGSGCIAATLALEIPNSKVTATDVSETALKLAKLNAKTLGARVSFIQTDLLKNLNKKQFDIICANLPYVPDNLVTSTEITKEPALALFSGTDGLDHYKQFFVEVHSLEYLPTYIVTESLESQHASLEKLAKTAGYQLIKTDILIQLFQLIS